MGNSGKSVVINPWGQVGLCEHYIDKNFISHIDNPCKKDDFEKVNSNKKRIRFIVN